MPTRALPVKLTALTLLCIAGAAGAQNDGALDPGFGDAGRSVFGFMQSDTPRLRAVLQFPETGSISTFADDPNDPSAVYLTRSFANGQPDPLFGSDNNGTRRLQLPIFLTPLPEHLGMVGALFQADGKALFHGALRPVPGVPAAYPGLVCRMTANGDLDVSFDGEGCRLVRNNLDPAEACTVTDVAIDPSGRFVVVGNCIGPTTGQRPFLARLTTSGGIDIDFAGGAGLISPLPPVSGVSGQSYRAVVVQPDGSIRVLGEFTTDAGDQSNRDLGVIAFDGGGGIDPGYSGDGYAPVAFDVAQDRNDEAIDLLRAPDGRLLLLGQARRIDTLTTVALIARLRTDGTLDTSFDGDGRRIEDFDGSLSMAARIGGFDVDPQGRIVVATSEVRGTPAAQVDSGTDFRLHLLPSVPPESLAQLAITANTATSGVVTGPTLGFPIAFNVQAGVPTVLNLPISLISIPLGGSGTIDTRSIRVQSTAPVQVTPLHGRLQTMDTTTILPVSRLGREYRVMSWNSGIGIGSQFSIVGTADNTAVVIRPATAIAGNPAGVPYTITLDAGEVYYGYSSLGDVSGSTISASAPVAVFAGHSCALVPNQNVTFCDLAYEQQLPVDTFGTVHVAMPTRADGDVLRFVAHAPDTSVYRNGVRIATLQAGQTFDRLFSSPAVFTTSAPAAVAQLGRGCTLAPDFNPDNCPGDPFLLRVEPVERWSSRQRVTVLASPFVSVGPGYAVLLALPATAVSSLRIDGAPAPVSTSFQPIAGTGLQWARIPLLPGSYRIEADAPFVAQLVHQAEGEAYAHTGAVLANGPTGAIADADSTDQVVRLRVDGSRDVAFGIQGRVSLPRAGFLSTPVTIRNAGDGILLGSGVRQLASGQHLLQVTRLRASDLFRDGFE
jgi:uncharacterized delta-60 repeat protein